MMDAKRVPIEILPGVRSDLDSPPTDAFICTDSVGIRWIGKIPYVYPGCKIITLPSNQFDQSGNALSGTPTWIFTYYDNVNSRTVTLVGTSSRLYAVYDLATNPTSPSVARNITPVQTNTNAIADSLDTYYKTLANNPATTTISSTTVTIADSSTKVEAGDSITLSGFPGDLNGIPQAQLNATHTVVTAGANSFTITVSTAASSSGSGGGASVVLATPIITVNAATHGLNNGDRVKIASAATTGGIPDTQINAEHIIRNKATNTFDIVATTKATSSVTGGGGGSTTYQKPIVAGTWGTEATDWFWTGGLFGDIVVMAPGAGGKLYEWDGNIAAAPVIVSNSPTNVNFCLVSDYMIVAVYGRTRYWCDQGTRTDWTAGVADTAGSDSDEGANPYVGYGQANGENLLYTHNQVWQMSYLPGDPLVWRMRKIFEEDGLCGRKAVRETNGILCWMGRRNYYRWYGGRVEPIPGNTLHKYIFSGDDIDWQRLPGKNHTVCADIRSQHNEAIWHINQGNTATAGQAITHSLAGRWWGKAGATTISACGEGLPLESPINAYSSGELVLVENHFRGGSLGFDGGTFFWSITTNMAKLGRGDEVVVINRLVPSIVDYSNLDTSVTLETGYDVTITTRLQPMDSGRTFTYAGNSELTTSISTRAHGRYWQINITGTSDGSNTCAFALGSLFAEMIPLGSR